MSNIINIFLDKIANAINNAEDIELFEEFDDIETFFLRNYDLIEESNSEIAQLGFELQTNISELDTSEDDEELLNNIDIIFRKMTKLNENNLWVKE